MTEYVNGSKQCLFLEYSKLGSSIGHCLIFAFAEIGDIICHWNSCKQCLFLKYARIGSRIGRSLIFAFAEIGDRICHWQ